MKDAKQEAVNVIQAEVSRVRSGQFTGAPEAVKALAAANLLATPEMRETMKCLSPKAAAAVSMSGGLVGVRLGIESDFVTPAMRQAVEACKALAQAAAAGEWAYCTKGQGCMDAGKAALAEEAARAPKPSYAVHAGSGICFGDWFVSSHGGPINSVFRGTEQQARAVADTLSGLERGK